MSIFQEVLARASNMIERLYLLLGKIDVADLIVNLLIFFNLFFWLYKIFIRPYNEQLKVLQERLKLRDDQIQVLKESHGTDTQQGLQKTLGRLAHIAREQERNKHDLMEAVENRLQMFHENLEKKGTASINSQIYLLKEQRGRAEQDRKVFKDIADKAVSMQRDVNILFNMMEFFLYSEISQTDNSSFRHFLKAITNLSRRRNKTYSLSKLSQLSTIMIDFLDLRRKLVTGQSCIRNT